MKQLLILCLIIAAVSGLSAQQEREDISAAEYMAWKVEHIPYKLKAVQYIEDYILVSSDSIPKATVADEFIVVKSRILGRGIRQIRYGKPGEPMTILDRSKLFHVFSESFLRTLLDREKYYYTEFRLSQ